MTKDLKPTQYEIDTWEGRKLCDETSLGVGYLGSCTLETHINQLRDLNSWVHVVKGGWLVAFEVENKISNEAHYRKVLERIRDWERTSAGSCNILRGFARKALEDVDKP